MGWFQEAEKKGGSVAGRAYDFQRKTDPLRGSFLSPTRQIEFMGQLKNDSPWGGGASDSGGMGVPDRPATPQQRLMVNMHGDLDPRFKVTPERLQLGTAGQALINRATATGESPWLQMQLEKQGQEQQDAMNAVAQQAAGQAASARAGMAMRGGLSGGARERLAMGAAQGAMLGQQGVARQGMESRLGARIADEQTKMSLLGDAAGMETGVNQYNVGQNLAAQQFNVGTAAQDLTNQNLWNRDIYGMQMGERGSIINANALRAAGKRSPWEIMLNPMGG